VLFDRATSATQAGGAGAPSSSARALGRIAQLEGEEALLDELERDDGGAESRLWVATGASVRVHIRAIQSVVAADYAQRIVQDRVANPHGEHAEECWEINPDALRAADSPARSV